MLANTPQSSLLQSSNFTLFNNPEYAITLFVHSGCLRVYLSICLVSVSFCLSASLSVPAPTLLAPPDKKHHATSRAARLGREQWRQAQVRLGSLSVCLSVCLSVYLSLPFTMVRFG